MPPNLAWFLEQYHTEISALRTQANLTIHPDWQALRLGDFSAYLPTRPVSPLLQTNWDQDWPYNSLCPVDFSGPGGHVYAGCGATTMGQIMKYWTYPEHGTGSHSYSHPDYGLLSADFANTTYNYNSMPNSLGYTANTAISTLLYHCGVALNMDYGPDGSGAYTTAVRPAFVNFFNFETTCQTVYKYAYTNTNWDALLRTELDASRPIFYTGQDPNNGGHAWVCDGYSGTNYFHMNWGWSGSANGYFYVSNLNPGMYNFSTQQGAVIGIRPMLAIAAPTNLTALVDTGNNVFLEWQGPLSRSLLGYTVYRNGTVLATLTDPLATQHYDINLTAGTYTYYVVANFSQGDSDPSNSVVATVYPAPVINYQEGFENFDDFATDLTPWFAYDVDLALTMELDYADFTHEGEPLSYLVFNPATAVPPVTELAPFFGDRLLVCFPSVETANNDWFCSPKWNTGNVAKFRFWARSAFADSGLAQIKVGLSTSTPEPQNMTIISGTEPVSVPITWTGYEFNLTANTYANVFVGLQCLSDNGSALLLDRFQLWSSYVDNEDATAVLPASLTMSAYPNPFKNSASLVWQQNDAEQVKVCIYDLKGRLVTTLADEFKAAGSHSLTWNGRDAKGSSVASGVYYCKLTGKSGSSAIRKLLFLK